MFTFSRVIIVRFDVFLRSNISLEIRPLNVLLSCVLAHEALTESLDHQYVNLAALKFSEMRNFRATGIN